MNRFSIVTPSLNQANYIRSAIQSVVNQVDCDFEYWVIDGGSVDDTTEILKSSGSSVQWISERDRGQSSAINRGWRTTDGDIIAWLNADDVYFPNAFATVREAFERDPELDMVYGTCEYIGPEGQSIGPYKTGPFDYSTLVRSAINFIPQPSVFLRRRVLKRVGYLDEHLNFVMDLDFWLRVGLRGKVIHIPKKLAAMRIHLRTKSASRLPQFGPELIILYRKLFARGDLPQEIVSLAREAKSNAYYLAAESSFWGGSLTQSMRFSLTSLIIRHHSPPRGLLRLIGWTALGPIGMRLARSHFSNPYLRGFE